ncbi:MAG: DegT/DnrJ/EryC1/StrS family aminotransferase [Planctomycetia bacterium]|nr:DegT/DnrJ/EryC1/StrS family aminotransferase [Planctomycetia bacterium]
MKAAPRVREIPFSALGGVFDEDDIGAALGVLRRAAAPGGNFFPLPEESDFQRAFAAHEGAAHAVAVNSCGTALDLCLMALGIGPGDEVITTPLTFVCTATCVIARGAKVVFADVDPRTLCLDPHDVRRRITNRTKAILPVHFTGLAADCDAFDAIASQTGVPIIYDAAHAVGTLYRGAAVGGRGLASCYSFQSNKNMTTLGEGGAVTTDDADFAEIVRRKKTFGYVYGPTLQVATVGFNYRMTKPQCAVGITQLAKIDGVIANRLAVFQTVHELLADMPGIIRPSGIEAGHGCHLYVVRLDTDRVSVDRAAFLKTLKDDYGVSCGVHYPAVWTWDVMRGLGYSAESAACPVAAKASEQVISLPLFPHTTQEDCSYIVWGLGEAIHQAGRPARAGLS